MDDRARRLERARAVADPEESARLSLALAREHLRTGRWDEAHAEASRAHDLASRAGEGAGEARAPTSASFALLRREALAARAAAALHGADGPAPGGASRDRGASDARTLDGALADAAAAQPPGTTTLGPALACALAERALARPPGRLARLAALRLVADHAATPAGPGADPRPAGAGDAARVLALLRSVADDLDPLARAQAARHPELAAALARDPAPLVRFFAREARLGARALRALARDDLRGAATPTRLFSAHGPDYAFGTFVAFRASTEARLAVLDPDLFAAADDLLGPGERLVGFGEGYGLVVPADAAAGDLAGAVAAVDLAGVLPFPLALAGFRPFDALGPVPRERWRTAPAPGRAPGASGDLPDPAEPDPGRDALARRLARRYALDLARHPARFGAGADLPVFARLLGLCFPGRVPPPASAADLLAEARAAYAAVGQDALARFLEQVERDARRGRPGDAGERGARDLAFEDVEADDRPDLDERPWVPGDEARV